MGGALFPFGVIMSSLFDIVQKHGGTLTLDGVEFTGRKKGRAPAPDQATLSFDSLEAYAAAMTEALGSGLAAKDANRSLMASIASDDRKEFSGGLIAELAPQALPFHPAASDVERARERIASSLLFQDFEASLAQLGTKRRRFFSEHDGEHLEDRALEIAPFLATKRQAAPVRMVNVVAQFSVSAYVEAERIQEYGATVAAVVSMLESAGILCGVSLEVRAMQGWESKTGARNYCAKVTVKRPDEYLPPASIAAALSANCYRRFGIGACPLIADIIGRTASTGCGYPLSGNTTWDAETGVLNISAGKYFRGKTGAEIELVGLLKRALGLEASSHAA